MSTSSSQCQPKPKQLQDRVAIVTGSSRRIGKEIAIHLASLGARIIVNYTSNLSQAKLVTDQINANSIAPRNIVVQADMSNSTQVKSLFDSAECAFDSLIHIVVHSAGILDGTYPSVANTTVESFDRTFAVNALLIAKKKQSSIKHVLAIEMEKHTNYTCNHEFVQEYNRLISLQETFVNEVLNNEQKPTHVNLEGVGNIDVGHLRQYPSVLTLAFDVKVRMKSYWKIVQKRFIDTISLHLMTMIWRWKWSSSDLEMEMVHDLLSLSGGGIERLLEESPSISGKREKLQRSAKILKARTLSQTSLFFMTQHVNSIPGTYFLIPLNQITYVKRFFKMCEM